MQVTRDNFPAVFPKFVELLQTCDFYAIDEEMTGINVADKPESITDTPEETYRAKREAASRYSIIQVGICLFHKDDDTNCGSAKKASYTARPFNFILFPTHVEGMTNTGLSQDVVLSASSLAFLRRHGMDFQSWVYRGLAYCNAAGETVLRQVWKERLDAEAGNGCGEQCQNSAGMDLLTEEERTWFSNAVAITQGFSERVQIALERAAAKHAGQGVGSVELTHHLN
ncbi:hypothetical protein TRVL_08018 [Trypanosoma vivax]|nr:hypothetical protein TRVL_08018 [Trypanosoma vivax]